MAMARGLGRALVALGFMRKRTFSRIRGVFPEKSEREVRAIAVESLQNLLMNAVEMMRASGFDRAWMDNHVLDGEMYKDRLQELVDEGNGVVIMVPHSGNWYMAAWSMAKYGLPLMSIAARQRNLKLDAWMNSLYGDIEVLDRDCRDTLSRIKEGLKSGRAFAILPDLRVRKRDIEADFLGGKANVSRAGAMFAVACGSPIVVAAMSRRGGRHVFNHMATLRPDPSAANRREEAARLTREAMKLLSDEIMRRPGEWFWYNTRWILEPVKEER
jgi:KDO2-lipid IV(A) lauroyltransferase